MQYFSLKVTNISKPVPDVVTISFKQPGLKKVKYKAGQYLTLIVRINGRKFIRPYSLSSAPGIDQHLEITIKRIPSGIVSNYLYDHIKIDDVIEVMEPMGDFLYDPGACTENQTVMLWGAGSGITPLISILKTVLNTFPSAKVFLFYCNRNPEHTIFQEELNNLKVKYSSNFTIWNFYTGIPEDVYLNYQIAGRINEQKIISVVPDVDELVRSIHYICGPHGLKQTIKSVLGKFNVPHDKILMEEFEILIDPEQFDDIETRMISIIQDGFEKTVEVIRGKSMLEAGLDAQIDLSYSCQTGTCTLCKAKLVSGKIKVIGIENIPEDIDKDECLLCCSYPYTDDIKVMIN